MFSGLGRFAARRRWWVIAGTLVFVLFGGIWGTSVFGAMTGGAGFDDPSSESVRADEVLQGPLGRYAPDVVVLYESTDRTVDDAQFASAVKQAVATVPQGAVTSIRSFWSENDPAFVSRDRHATYVAVQLPSTTDQGRVTELKAIKDGLADAPGLTVKFGGVTAMTAQVNAHTGRDILVAELVSMPLLIILLVIVFRSLVAAAIPLLTGIVVALGSFTLLKIITSFADISTFAINVVTMLGFGLAIDYGLFMVSRFREELAAGRTVDDAVARTTATAGRTVAYSGLTVAAVLACLVLFPARFLSSMGYAGVSVVLFAVVSSLTLLPAVLRFAGQRINSLRLPLPRRRQREADGTGWYRTAKRTMRKPVLSTVGILVVLVALGLPFLGVNWARPAEWVLPRGEDAREVTKALDADFTANPAKIATVVVRLPGSADGAKSAVEDYAARVGAVPGITSAKVTGTHENLARVTLGYSLDPMSREAPAVVDAVRAVPPPAGATTLVTGMPASRVDIVRMIESRLPWMGLAVLVVSFVVMFFAFGSVVLPLKSAVFNLLSLSASFGAIKLIFQDGWLSGLLGFDPIGAVDINFPVLVVAIAFGLAMDYEVFLLSRIREAWDRTGDVDESIAVGLQKTGRIITNAAVLFIAVVVGFLFSGIVFMKMIAVGLIIAVIVDATIVRGLLVPATMKLLGKWAWWSPAPLARWWQNRGLGEVAEPEREPQPTLVG
ncbi:MMPL family transporter [Lentzea aerocolonigenes]|uniref:MMPL family transporter n=1 Tax=Lentzea aerocolonigenes TaxID=68170 RepID=UPI0004C39628|nr:MMPL family transporter [Lentzea aerocolonigenes]MCP2248791.1 putative drug exporter of the RND superfamily [Lentzea aerocolonigenes]